MTTNKQDIEKLREEIVVLRNENKEYEKKLMGLLQKKQRDEAAIKIYSESISANNQQIIEKEKQITKLTNTQGKITAPPICCIFRQIMY